MTPKVAGVFFYRKEMVGMDFYYALHFVLKSILNISRGLKTCSLWLPIQFASLQKWEE